MELLTKNKLLTAVLAVLSVAGIGAYIFQLAGGLAVTGMSNGVSWGLYITMFMFFVGLSAGGLIVASSASVFHIKRFKAVAMPAIILSTVCICLAGMFVLIDLGGIQRIWRIVTGPNPTSPLVWDICVITLYLVINVLYLVNMRRGNDHAVSVISRFALPCAILVHSVTAWIFGLQIAKEGWYSAIMAPIFVASAMDSGLALLLCVLAALKKARLFETSRELMASLAGLLATCIAVDVYKRQRKSLPSDSGCFFELLDFRYARWFAQKLWQNKMCKKSNKIRYMRRQDGSRQSPASALDV